MSTCTELLLRRKSPSTSSGCEVEVNITATGNLLRVLAECSDYMRAEMPHVNRISKSEVSKFERYFEKLNVDEINAKWRFDIAEVLRWSDGDDSFSRPFTALSCRGDEYEKVCDYVRARIPGCTTLGQDFVEDVVLSTFIIAIIRETIVIDLKKVFNLHNDELDVHILIDSCCFDPRIEGGDTLHLSWATIGGRISSIRKVFTENALRIVAKGAFENLISEGCLGDEDTSEEEGELDSDDYDSDFVVDDDVCE